jgi:hypothetical protein
MDRGDGMTWRDLIMYGPGWAACALIPVNWWLDHRFRRQYQSRWGVPYRAGDS